MLKIFSLRGPHQGPTGPPAQGPTIPAEMLSKEYFTYYIILGILLGSIIIPVTGCSTRSPARRRLDGFGPARGAHCGGFAGLARAHTRGTRIGRRRGREPRIVRHLSHPAPCPASLHPHCCSLPHMIRTRLSPSEMTLCQLGLVSAYLAAYAPLQ